MKHVPPADQARIWAEKVRGLLRIDAGKPGPRVYFRRLAGAACRGNRSILEALEGVFAEHGCAAAESLEEADAIILDGCNLNPAQHSQFEESVALARAQPKKTVLFSGCVPPHALAGPGDLPPNFHVVPFDRSVLEVGSAGGEEALIEVLPADSVHPHWRPTWSRYWGAAGLRLHDVEHLLVSTGCRDACAFCPVQPYRGAVKSLPLDFLRCVHDEALSRGRRRFWLLADELGSWGRDAGLDLGDLLDALNAAPVSTELYLGNAHPARLIELYSRVEPRLDRVRMLHLPIQSGSDRILGRMGRGHSASDVASLVERLRIARPRLLLATDVLIGFPGETRHDFMDSLEIAANFDVVFFSPMKHFNQVPASRFDGRVGEREVAVREAIARAVGERECTHDLARIAGRDSSVVWVRKGPPGLQGPSESADSRPSRARKPAPPGREGRPL